MTVADMVFRVVKKISAAGTAPVEPAIDSINEVVKFLSYRLADRKSDLVIGLQTENVAIQTVLLPFDFNGFVKHPSVNNKELTILPADFSVAEETAVQPLHYEVLGDILYLYPTPSEAVTYVGKYWMVPDTLALTDELPFLGKFDKLITDMAVKFCAFGYDVLASSVFLQEVESGLDTVLLPRKASLPIRRPYRDF